MRFVKAAFIVLALSLAFGHYGTNHVSGAEFTATSAFTPQYDVLIGDIVELEVKISGTNGKQLLTEFLPNTESLFAGFEILGREISAHDNSVRIEWRLQNFNALSNGAKTYVLPKMQFAFAAGEEAVVVVLKETPLYLGSQVDITNPGLGPVYGALPYKDAEMRLYIALFLFFLAAACVSAIVLVSKIRAARANTLMNRILAEFDHAEFKRRIELYQRAILARYGIPNYDHRGVSNLIPNGHLDLWDESNEILYGAKYYPKKDREKLSRVLREEIVDMRDKAGKDVV